MAWECNWAAQLAQAWPGEDFGLPAAFQFPQHCGSDGHSDTGCIKHGVSHFPCLRSLSVILHLMAAISHCPRRDEQAPGSSLLSDGSAPPEGWKGH